MLIHLVKDTDIKTGEIWYQVSVDGKFVPETMTQDFEKAKQNFEVYDERAKKTAKTVKEVIMASEYHT